jgi:tRNA (cytidine/uridine-2'-O-)-methyltransferase
LLTTKAKQHYANIKYADNCFLVFGKETAGLPEWFRERFPERCLRIPMIDNAAARSLNLSNSAAIVVYEAIRQLGLLN